VDLSIEKWESSTASQREAEATCLAMQLPLGFTFQGVRQYQLEECRHHVALYQKDNATFALIPGGSVWLGHDGTRPYGPNPDELESWRETAKEYGIEKTLHEYFAEVTTPIRRVEISPFLIETVAGELGWEAIGVDDPAVRAILKKHRGQGQVEVSREGTSIRVCRGADGVIVAQRSPARTHAELAALLAAEGYRFPTSDEWEYACGGGTQTLFRWGDHVPCDRYPTDISPGEAAWRKQWVLSAGKLARPTKRFDSDWDYHCQPNAFGLLIASDPYKSELVAEIGTTRGGDGGSTICGGAGFFAGWLTLATPYFEEHSCKHDPSEAISHEYTVGRRVLELR